MYTYDLLIVIHEKKKKNSPNEKKAHGPFGPSYFVIIRAVQTPNPHPRARLETSHSIFSEAKQSDRSAGILVCALA
jgi:hypothetical protein